MTFSDPIDIHTLGKSDWLLFVSSAIDLEHAPTDPLAFHFSLARNYTTQRAGDDAKIAVNYSLKPRKNPELLGSPRIPAGARAAPKIDGNRLDAAN